MVLFVAVLFRAFHRRRCVSDLFSSVDSNTKNISNISLFLFGGNCEGRRKGLSGVFSLTTPSARLSLLPLSVRGRANDLDRYRGNRASLR